MRLAILVTLVVAGCGPRAPARGTQEPDHAVQGDPKDAPPDPVGATSPSERSCNNDGDCDSGETCFAPDFTPGRGAPPECQSDDECPKGQVCGGSACMARCERDSCGAGQRCTDNGHCEARPCNDPKAARCPRNHRCDAASGTCQRIACTAASACDSGTCWNGRCYARGGYCMPESYCCPP